MSEPYRGSRLPHCRWRAALAASLAPPATARVDSRGAGLAIVRERERPPLRAQAVTKHTSSAARTGTAVGKTSLSFSDPLPQAPPALWGTGTTGEHWDTLAN